MKYVRFGATELKVSKLGLGCGGPSKLGIAYSKINAGHIIRTAIDLGINFIDTAPAYGTEEVVGWVLSDLEDSGVKREDLVVCTKTAHRLAIRAGWKTLVERTIKNLEKSLKALRTDYIDVFYFHAPQLGTYQPAYDMLRGPLEKQRERGKVKFFGVSEDLQDRTHKLLGEVNKDSKAYRDEGLWDVVMYGRPVPYSYGSGTERATVLMATNRETKTDKMYSKAKLEADVILCGTGDEAHLRANVRKFE